MYNKKETLDNLNILIADLYDKVKGLKEEWESEMFQKKLSVCLGIKTKSKDKPKRNKSSYLFFCQEYRPRILEEHPKIKPNEIMIHMGEIWREMSDEAKKKYEMMALEDKKRYILSKNINKKILNPIKPSVYLQFCSDERQRLKKDNPDCETKKITHMLGKLWNEYKLERPEYLKSKYNYTVQ